LSRRNHLGTFLSWTGKKSRLNPRFSHEKKEKEFPRLRAKLKDVSFGSFKTEAPGKVLREKVRCLRAVGTPKKGVKGRRTPTRDSDQPDKMGGCHEVWANKKNGGW